MKGFTAIFFFTTLALCSAGPLENSVPGEEAAVGIGSFVNADGNIQTVGYTVDKLKEQAEAVKDAPLVKGSPRVVRSALAPAVVQLPLPVQYTPEVAAARAEHLRVLSQSYLRSGGYFPITYVQAPAPYVIPGAQYHPDYLPYAAL